MIKFPRRRGNLTLATMAGTPPGVAAVRHPDQKQEASSPMPTSPKSDEKSYPIALRDLFERGHSGDATVLPELKNAFDEHPVLSEKLGNMPGVALESLLSAISGKSLTVREAVRREAERLCEDLAGPDSPLPVRLLAARVAITWVEVYHADTELAGALKKRLSESPQMQAAERRAQAAQDRYLAAIEALERVRKLTQPNWPGIGWPTVIDEEARQNRAGTTSSRGDVAVVSA
jgi:hypothetical protein